MATTLDPAEIENIVRTLITAETTNLGVQIALPVAYGDGDMVSVFVDTIDGSLVLHDAGFSAMRLSSAGIRLTQHVMHRLRDLARRYRCDFEAGRVVARSDIKELPQTICLVANAARSVADYAYEIRRQAENDFRIIVFERLRDIVGRRMRQHEEFKGKSGRIYHLPIILDRAEQHPQNFVSALGHRHAVAQSFAMFHDLSAAYPTVERDAVYDESSDIRDEDRVFLAYIANQVMGLMEAPLRFRGVIGHG